MRKGLLKRIIIHEVSLKETSFFCKQAKIESRREGNKSNTIIPISYIISTYVFPTRFEKNRI